MTARRLLLLLALALGLRLFFWGGVRGSDDLYYMELGLQQMRGTWKAPPDVQSVKNVSDMRPALPAAAGLALRVLGPCEAAFLLYPLFCSLAMVALLYGIAAAWLGPGPALATGLVAALLPGYVLAGSSLYPDLPPALWISVSLALLWAAPGAGRWRLPAALASGLAFGLSIHHKETALLLLPCLLLLGLTPSRRCLLPWALASLALWFCLAWGGCAVRMIQYNLWVFTNPALRGDASFAYDPLLNPMSGGAPSILRRLCWDFTKFLVSPKSLDGFSMWGGVAFLSAGGVWLAVRRRSAFLGACALWAALGFLALDTAGIPGPGYVPIHPVSPRYLGLVMPPFLLLAGAFLAWLWEVLPGKGRGALVLATVGGALLFNEMAVTPNRDLSRTLRMVHAVLEQDGDREVWTDDRTGQALAFLNAGLRTHPLPLAGELLPSGALVVLNGPKLAFLAGAGRPLPEILTAPPREWTLLVSRHVLGIFGKGRGDPRRISSVYRAGPAGPRPPAASSSSSFQGISARQQLVAAIMSIGLIVFIFELVRRRRLREEYSWLWMLSGAVILLFALCYPALGWVTTLIGAKVPTSTLFFFGFFFLILICIHYAVKVSTLTMQVKNLMQELAILREEAVRRRKDEGAP